MVSLLQQADSVKFLASGIVEEEGIAQAGGAEKSRVVLRRDRWAPQMSA